MKMFPQPIKQH